MKIYIPENVKTIISILQQNHFEAYIVGGCVRDCLCERRPHDWDICTSALPSRVKECFSDFETVDIGIQHGTVAVVMKHELFEITTYRIDGDYKDNRHPESVVFTDDLTRDLARRDFTVNAMAYNDVTGLVDPFGGAVDLQRKIIRCVGNPDERFNEDALRILRALRFASVYGFTIEKATSRAIHENAGLLKKIAYERIREELIRLICGEGAERILNDYRDVIAVLIPELAESFDFDQHNIHHKYDVYRHITHSVGIIDKQPILRMTMLLHDIGKPRVCTVDDNGTCHFKGHQQISADMAKVILKRLKFPNHLIDACLKLIIYHDVRFNGSKKQVKRVLNQIGAENMRMLLKVQCADTMSQSEYMRREKLSKIETAQAQTEEILRENQCFSLKQLAINGTDFISAGMTDGKQIGRILNQLLDEVIDERIENEKTALLSKAQKLYLI